MKLFDHAYSFGLEVTSSDEYARDVTGSDLRRALLARLAAMSDEEVKAACDGGSPFDSHEVERETVDRLQALGRLELPNSLHDTKVIAAAARRCLLNPELAPVSYQCSECGSTEVLHDAWAEWNEPEQRLELAETFDATHCRQCDGECKMVTVPLEGENDD